MTSKQTLSSKITVIGLLILLVFLGNWKYKQWAGEKLIQQQKQELQQQADALQKKNNELSQSLQYLNSDSFKESVARQQLNLKKPGEQVYTFVDASQSGQVQSQGSKGPSNVEKWFEYFFSN
jgi:cell division protein FtsB